MKIAVIIPAAGSSRRFAQGLGAEGEPTDDLTMGRSKLDEDLKAALELDVAILKRCEPAPDRLAERVDLFPLHGVTPGTSGILVAGPGSGIGTGTALICGDAVPTVEHLEHGMIMHGAVDVHAAQESFREAIEIADILVLGRDNWMINPVRRGY